MFWSSATGWAIDRLLGLAHWVSGLEGAVASLPTMSRFSFAAMILGGLWLCLWTTRPRWLGLVPLVVGAIGAAATPTPDLLVTGDGRHLAITVPDGPPVILRDKSGDFMRSLMSEASGHDGEPGLLAEQGFSNCRRDACFAEIDREGKRWVLLATRSRDSIAWRELVAACAAADIVVSERWLPSACKPRWLKLDRAALAASGGVAIFLGDAPRVESVAERLGQHPWRAEAPQFKPRVPRPHSQPFATPRARFPTDR